MQVVDAVLATLPGFRAQLPASVNITPTNDRSKSVREALHDVSLTLLGTIARRTNADVNVISLIGERGREVKDFIEHSLGPEGLARSVDELVGRINALGYGLTLGIHTRIDSRALRIAAQAHVGNVYVNRNMIGAVVGVQPFGGEGLSGTGPKAGGPNYLMRFCSEQTVTVNTTAAGGNVQLLA